MTPDSALDLFRQALLTALLLASPMLAAGLVIGLAVSVFQAVTSIQEMTLTFIPKMIGVILALLIALPWMLSLMTRFTTQLLGNLGAWA
jgi:flagellar biosynthetic protein FliQ